MEIRDILEFLRELYGEPDLVSRVNRFDEFLLDTIASDLRAGEKESLSERITHEDASLSVVFIVARVDANGRESWDIKKSGSLGTESRRVNEVEPITPSRDSGAFGNLPIRDIFAELFTNSVLERITLEESAPVE